MNWPNVACFVLDQLRYSHLGYAGNSVATTPNIDTFAERGIVSYVIFSPTRQSCCEKIKLVADG